MRAAKVQASLRIRAVSPEPSLLAHTSSESRGTFIQKARSLAPLNGWACAVKICHDGMLEDNNSLDGAHTTDKEKADCLNDFFTSISHVCDEHVQLPEFSKITDSTFESFDISENEIVDILSTLNINKTCGPDLVSHKMLKYVAKLVSKPLFILFNRSLRERHFPEIWT